MPSPVAHIGAALALQLAFLPAEGGLGPLSGTMVPGAVKAIVQSLWSARRVTLVAAFASIAPDLDILLAVLHPAGLDWHRGPSHSLVGAALIGVVCASVARIRGGAGWATIVSAAMLHVVFDWSTGEPGAPSRYGVPWAWPISSEKAMDANPWFGAFHIDKAGFLANMWSPRALPVYLGELATVALLVTAAIAVRFVRVAIGDKSGVAAGRQARRGVSSE